jgi:tetratricopeptide (TPR) repeat protein/DNA-binding transcriptional ArsR family regulator
VSRIVGGDRVTAEPDAAAAVVSACGHLPLAVSIAAARLAAREEWTFAELGERLTDERRRLDELKLGDLDVRASIGLSYEALDQNARRLLRRLGLIATPDWPSWVAYEVDDNLSADAVEGALDRLTDAHLIEALGRDPVGQVRYRLHDLVAEYASERAHAEEDEQDRTEAVTRILSGWLALATEADDHIEHGYANVTEGLARPVPPAGSTLPVADTARFWFDTERINLTAAVGHACRVGNADLAGELAIRLSGYSLVYGYQDDIRRTLDEARNCVRDAGQDDLLYRVLVRLYNCVVDYGSAAALESVASEILAVARRLGRTDWFGRACIDMCVAMLKQGRIAAANKWLSEGRTAVESDDDTRLNAGFWNVTAMARIEAGRAAEAVAPMERALDFQRQAGRTRVVAVYLSNYGEVLIANSRLSDAEIVLNESTQLAREFGDETYPAYNEGQLAVVDMRRGDWSKAAQRLASARQVHEASGTVDGLADVERALGELYLATGRPTDAIHRFDRACQTWRSLDVPLNITRSLARLELAHRAAGDTTAAEACRTEWRSILDELELDEACLLLPPFLTADSS